MKYPIARSAVFRPLLSLFSATANRSFIDVDADALDIRFGFFHQRILRSHIRAVSLRPDLPWYERSLGWRTDLAGGIGLIGAAFNFVQIELTEPRRMFIGIPVSATRIVVSLERPMQFVEALNGV